MSIHAWISNDFNDFNFKMLINKSNKLRVHKGKRSHLVVKTDLFFCLDDTNISV